MSTSPGGTSQSSAQPDQLGDAGRRALAVQGFDALRAIVDRLWLKVQMQAPQARRVILNRMGNFECHVPNGRLTVNFHRSEVLRPGVFNYSGWDVVGWSEVCVIQLEPSYAWSANLWFAKIKGGVSYRWFEASYWSENGSGCEPRSLVPGRDADTVACGINCGINYAFGPVEIDGDQESAFQERWLWLLAKLSVGKLRRPDWLPRQWPPLLS